MEAAQGHVSRSRESLRTQRRTMSVGQVAARLEHRLYLAEPNRVALLEGCLFAVRRGLSRVIVRPEVVSSAALHLAGTSVGLVTVLGWRGDGVKAMAGTALSAEARWLVGEGATDVAVLADAGRLARGGGRHLAEGVTALVEDMRPHGAQVRVILDTDGLSPAATIGACELLGEAGVWLVQGGSWRGSRTGLSRIQLMRAALPAKVQLKWTFPIMSLDSMMICVAEGVHRFNADPEALLQEAARRCASGPLIVPKPGVDY